jgi:hypothetical protein
VYAGDCAGALAAFASDTVNELRDNVEEFAFGCQLVNLSFYFGRFEVLYGHRIFLGSTEELLPVVKNSSIQLANAPQRKNSRKRKAAEISI